MNRNKLDHNIFVTDKINDKEGNYMQATLKVKNEDYRRIIQDVYKRKMSAIDIESLACVIIHLDKRAREERLKRLLVEQGSSKIIDDLNHYINRIFFKNYQLKQMKKIVDKILKIAIKAGKKIPKKNKWSRNSYKRFLKKINMYKNILLKYIPKED